MVITTTAGLHLGDVLLLLLRAYQLGKADALNARQEMLSQVAFQKKLVGDYQEAYRQSRLRFEAGLDSYFSTMDAQRSLFEAQQRWAQLELAREINQVTLYKALGGGWSPSLKVAQC